MKLVSRLRGNREYNNVFSEMLVKCYKVNVIFLPESIFKVSLYKSNRYLCVCMYVCS